MYIKKFNIKNFKTFKDITFLFNADVNILTGKNNTGKTTVLEALALWHECFGKLIHNAKRAEKKFGYKAGDWIFGPLGTNRYFPFDEINSVLSPYFEDIFHQRNRKNEIILSATISDTENTDEIEIPFVIGESGMNYDISLHNYTKFDFGKFNAIFKRLPEPIGKYYASPVAVILQKENFATAPQIKDEILNRNSANVLRNRLYKLLSFPIIEYRNKFIFDLSYILGQNIELILRSDIQKDRQVIINFKFGNQDVEKDIALVGSGTLQIIEILLNLYQPDETFNNLHFYNQGLPIKDFNIILLDEPDSHIHREIQQRLTDLISRFSKNNQIFISTHNESLIRSASYEHLFHLDGKKDGLIKSIEKENTEKIQPRFKGLYPSQINPIIRSLGEISGLDFINAMEADRLIFVEGEDDARVINLLLKQQTPPTKKKYMFWVLGGISTAFESINAYKTVFSAIKNNKTLWEKSLFIFDKDYLSDNHKDLLCSKLNEILKIESYSWNSYTFETILLQDIDKFSNLLALWLAQKTNIQVDLDALTKSIYTEYHNYKQTLEARFTHKYYENAYFRYKDIILTKSEKVFGSKLVQLTEPQLMTYIRQNNNQILAFGELHKLMNKDDFSILINKSILAYDISFSIEADFVDLIKLVNKAFWFDDWNFLTKI
jgi:AAA15 family ATPase/GTPase